MTKSYMVTGSDDGPLGIFTSHAKALTCAVQYVNNPMERVESEGWDIDKGTWATYVSHPKGDSTATIEVFNTNYNPFNKD
tara:strand:+ start:458 stop:697 length:240 start_codon:yes stop_codon:yes gene_type:complete